MKRSIPIVGAGAVGPWGLGWRGRADFRSEPAPSRQLSLSHPEVLGMEVPELTEEQDAGDRRQRKLMSRAARLGAIALREALRDAEWGAVREEVGYYLGVGASGAHMEEIPSALDASLVEGAFSTAAFGERGIYACNPLFVFQLMNNFTLCHGAILEGLGGPNAAFYSRGAGTLSALEEAVAALEEGICDRVLVGGADSAHHAVTWSEFVRDGLVSDGLVPGEGAAVLALAQDAQAPEAWLQDWGIGLGNRRPEVVMVAGWSPAVAQRLAREVSAQWEVPLFFWDGGEALAATPPMAWALGLDRIREGAASVLVLTEGLDGTRIRVHLGSTP